MSRATDTTEKDHFLISEDREKELWSLLDQYRGTHRMLFLPAIRWLREQGEQLEVSEMLYIQQQFGLNQGPLVLPFSVVQFYNQLLYSRKASRVLDPTGGCGLLGAWLSSNEHVQQMDVVSRDADAKELISPLDLPSLTLHIGNIADEREKLAAKYDAIVSIPCIGIKSQYQTFQTIDGDKIELNDEPSSLLIAEVADLLDQDGILAFVVSPKFAWDKKNNSIRFNLEKFGLYLSALLKFRPGTFRETNLVLYLAIIERIDHGNLFVAEVPEEARGQNELITRLWKRKKGPTPSQGWIVTDDQFLGLQALEATERAKKLALSKGLDPIPFNKAVIKINAPKRRGTDFERCKEHLDAIYLPEVATTEAKMRQDDLPERLKSYLQLIADPEVVLPEYLAEMLNTPLGHSIREAAMKGAAIPRISKTIISESILYLPPVVEQRRAMGALSSIQRLRSELAEIESQVWEKPRRVSKVIEALSKVNREERFGEWLDSLPFPLASILQSYHAIDLNDKEKYVRLLRFFEAFAEFCATVHLSAFRKSQAHWEPFKSEHQDFSFKTPSFGLWIAVVEPLAKQLRSMLNGKPEDKALANTLYATADSRPLEILSSKKLVTLMKRVNEYRNLWKGHDGDVTPTEALNLHNLLAQDLADFREIVGTKFLQYQLIEPHENRIIQGPIYQFRVRRMMGSNPQLESQIVEMRTAAISERLYLHNPGHDEGLELIPLIIVRNEPYPASYFYNRFDQTGLRFIAHHFNNQSTITIENCEAVQLLIDDFNQSREET